MTRKILFAALLIFVVHAAPLMAAEMTLIRQSRPVTALEAAGGAPAGGMVHDFYATSDADLLAIVTDIDLSLYQHPNGTDNSAPNSQSVAAQPALGADSFLRMPNSTLVFGGFAGAGPEDAWFDITNDGPQTNFLFGRLTLTQTSTFPGIFGLRGLNTSIDMPFSFTLPGPTGPLTEQIVVSGFEQSFFSSPPLTPPSELTTDRNELTLVGVDSGIGVSSATQAWLDSPRPKLSSLDIPALKTAQLRRGRPPALAAQQIPEPSGLALGAAAVIFLSRWRPRCAGQKES